MSRKGHHNLPTVRVVEKRLREKGTAFQKEKPVFLEVKNFFLSEEAKPVGKWERIRDCIPVIDLINKIISFF